MFMTFIYVYIYTLNLEILLFPACMKYPMVENIFSFLYLTINVNSIMFYIFSSKEKQVKLRSFRYWRCLYGKAGVQSFQNLVKKIIRRLSFLTSHWHLDSHRTLKSIL